MKDIKSFLPRVNCKIATCKLREYFQEVDTKKRSEITFDEFVEFYQKLMFDESVCCRYWLFFYFETIPVWIHNIFLDFSRSSFLILQCSCRQFSQCQTPYPIFTNRSRWKKCYRKTSCSSYAWLLTRQLEKCSRTVFHRQWGTVNNIEYLIHCFIVTYNLLLFVVHGFLIFEAKWYMGSALWWSTSRYD